MTEASLSQSQPAMSFTGEIDSAEKTRVQSEIARGFYAAGLPFRTIEVPRMRRALTILQPEMDELRRNPVYSERIPNVPKSVQSSILASINAKWSFLHTDTMGVSFFLDQTKTSTGFVSTDLAKSVVSVKKVARRMVLGTTTVEEKQIGDEATEFYLQKELWSSETRVEQEALSSTACKDDKANIFYQVFDEGESDDAEDDEGSLVDIEYNSDDDNSVGSGFSNSNAYSYDGSEEQGFEYEFEC
ncbi:hypothetical protein PC112_g7271 [Phytophthora cactorum]|nr:hypothetical protein PC112_g7271 [Phytophthora cactorum]